jgi:hypothetical protein
MKHIRRIFVLGLVCVIVLGTLGLLYPEGIIPVNVYSKLPASGSGLFDYSQPMPTILEPSPLSISSPTLSGWQYIPIVTKGSKSGEDGAPGPLVVSGSNPRLLVTSKTQEPVLLVGDAGWSAIAQITTSEMDTYLENRASHGFNVVLTNLIEHYYADNAPNNIYNDPPFTGANFTTPNEDYFAVADYFISKANSLGIYVLLTPIYLGFADFEGWIDEIDAASTADMQSWGEYVGNRYKDYDNIIWVIGGDRDPSSVMIKVEAFVTGLQNADTRHTVITVHGAPGSIGTTDFGDQSWLTLDTIYINYLETSNRAYTAYALSPTRPFFKIEGEYEPNISAQNLRAQMYWTILGGGIGHIFGRHTVWSFDTGWETVLDSPGAEGMHFAGLLFQSIAWETLVPDSAHSLITSGYGTIDTDNYAGAAINNGGTLAVIYMPSNRTMTVDMRRFSGTVIARWYDPTSGQYEDDPASPLSNSGMHNFSHPGANNDGDADWVLVLDP